MSSQVALLGLQYIITFQYGKYTRPFGLPVVRVWTALVQFRSMSDHKVK